MREVQGRGPLPALVGVAAGVVALDHLTKWLALQELSHRDIDLVWTLRLRLVFNNGASFGLGSRYAPLIALVAMVIVLGLLGFGRRLQGRVAILATGAVVGGALGNLLDRVFRDGDGFLGGPVVDFIDLQWWPVFNVADIAIVVGAGVLALSAERAERASS